MAKSKFISIQTFCELYGASKSNIYSLYSQDYIPKAVIKTINNTTFIDANYFLRRQKFARNIQLQAQDYYYLLQPYLKDSQMAKALLKTFNNKTTVASMVNFLGYELFATYENRSIIDTRFSNRLWYFYRWSRWCIMEIKSLSSIKHLKIDKVTKDLLDKRMVA